MQLSPDSVAVYLTIRVLEAEDRPGFVFRKDGRTILVVDPRSTRREVVLLTTDEVLGLTDEEATVARAAFGIGPRNLTRLPESYVLDLPCLLYVPSGLRLDGEHPLQGGTELERRIEADELDEELLLLDAEQRSRAG